MITILLLMVTGLEFAAAEVESPVLEIVLQPVEYVTKIDTERNSSANATDLHDKSIKSRSASYYEGPNDDSDLILAQFDATIPQNVTAGLGFPAFLGCRVKRLGDKMVSWIRTRDFHVLTVGLYRYTTDQRFSATYDDDSNKWILKISHTNLKDIGTYECQVSSDPKLSYFVSLNVVVPKTRIKSAPDLYLRSGSTIELQCIISQSPKRPVFVFWYHNDRMINYDVERGTTISAIHKVDKNTARSVLYIKNAVPSDSGNYSCLPSNSKKAHITVHVLNGEQPAAMQGNTGDGGRGSSCRIYPISCLLLLTFIYHQFMFTINTR
ncbi:Uncharacterised protein g5725 [Pycnogonum litorale]